MHHRFGKEKIKKLKTPSEFAVYFLCPKNLDMPKNIINIIEFQLYYIKANGIHVDTVINKTDAIVKSLGLGCKKFVILNVNYLVDWNKNLLDYLVSKEFNTAIGDKGFYKINIEYADKYELKDYTYEYAIPYKKLEIIDMLQSLKSDKKYFNSNYFRYDAVIDKIKSLKIQSIILSWAEERTKKIIKQLESYDCEIFIYHDKPIKFRHPKVKEMFEWNIFSKESKKDIFQYLSKLNELTYFDTGSNFVDFDKSIFFSTQQRAELALQFNNELLQETSNVVMGGVFPWQHQAIFKYPKHHNWMYYPWNLEKF